MKRERGDEDDIDGNVEGQDIKTQRFKLYNSNIYDDAPVTPNIMMMSKEDRIRYVNTVRNPYAWPEEYYEIYMKERLIRNPNGFDNTFRINGMRLFKVLNDQFGKVVIKQNSNVNCIKGNPKDYMDIDDFTFSPAFKKLFAEKYNYILGTDEEYAKEIHLKFIEKNEELQEYDGSAYDFLKSVKEVYDEFVLDSGKIVTRSVKKENNIYKILLAFISLYLEELSQYVCVAGGFALSMYIYETYGYNLKFNDIDLFIHSCDVETANEIIRRISLINTDSSYYNENVFTTFITNEYAKEKYFEGNKYINLKYVKNIGIQIIRRLYTSPAQIIIGFDVDCCCILTTMSGEIFATERGIYSIKNGYNVVNFDRLSPSYEYRIKKYNDRGFGIWIPYVNHFKDTTLFDVNEIDRSKPSSIIISKLFPYGSFYRKNVHSDTEVSDYHVLNYGNKYNNAILEFKTLNPNEQIINTFHRVVFQDPIDWYQPIRNDILENFTLDGDTNEQEINEYINVVNLKSYNVMRKNKTFSRDPTRTRIMSFKILTDFNSMLPGLICTGDLIDACLTGTYFRQINFYHPLFNNKEVFNKFRYDTFIYFYNLNQKRHFKSSKLFTILKVPYPENLIIHKIYFGKKNPNEIDNIKFFNKNYDYYINKKFLYGVFTYDEHFDKHFDTFFTDEYKNYMSSIYKNNEIREMIYKIISNNSIFYSYWKLYKFNRNGFELDIPHKIIKDLWVNHRSLEYDDKNKPAYDLVKEFYYAKYNEVYIEDDEIKSFYRKIVKIMSSIINRELTRIIPLMDATTQDKFFKFYIDEFLLENVSGSYSKNVNFSFYKTQEELPNEGIRSENGKFYTSQYNFNMLSNNLSKYDILNYPIWQSYFPSV